MYEYTKHINICLIYSIRAAARRRSLLEAKNIASSKHSVGKITLFINLYHSKTLEKLFFMEYMSPTCSFSRIYFRVLF